MIYVLLILSLQGQLLRSIQMPTLDDCIAITVEINDEEPKLRAACLVRHTGEPS